MNRSSPLKFIKKFNLEVDEMIIKDFNGKNCTHTHIYIKFSLHLLHNYICIGPDELCCFISLDILVTNANMIFI